MGALSNVGVHCATMELTCIECRHVVDLGGTESARCPNCGHIVRVPASQRPAAPPIAPAVTDGAPPNSPEHPFLEGHEPQRVTKPAAVASLVCSLVVCIPFVTQALALGFGIFALVRKRKENERVTAAWIGIVLGTLALIGWGGVFLLIPQGPAWATGVWTTPPNPSGNNFEWLTVEKWGEQMKQIAQAIKMHRRDYGDWPDSLDEMRGNYLRRSFELQDGLTFRPVPKDNEHGGKWILVYSEPTRFDTSATELSKDHHVVLRLSGLVETISAEAFNAEIDEQSN